MVTGFVLGFIAAYATSAAIVTFLSTRMASQAKPSDVLQHSNTEASASQMLFDELRCM